MVFNMMNIMLFNGESSFLVMVTFLVKILMRWLVVLLVHISFSSEA